MRASPPSGENRPARAYQFLMRSELIELTDRGLYCPVGDFYIDPWRAVERAVVTHGHSDHARWGSQWYLGAKPGEHVLRSRLHEGANIQSLAYGEPLTHNGVRISLHPAGHVLGSAQVRLEHEGYVWVITGDYKLQQDPTCAPFEPVKCHGFLTESTFGLPIYRWEEPRVVFDQMNAWWRSNQEQGKCSILYAYSLGKAQRLQASVDPSIGPIYTHAAVEKLNEVYRQSGVELPETTLVSVADKKTDWSKALVVAPPSELGKPWTRTLGLQSSGYASGWMRVRGARRRQSVDRGFVVSDHVDWQGILWAVKESGAEKVWATHGQVGTVVRYLQEQGLEARGLKSFFEREAEVPRSIEGLTVQAGTTEEKTT
jgi:putative mRNA 3-end processing factor